MRHPIHPDEVTALITEGAFTSFRDIAIHSSPWFAKPFTWTFFVNPYSSKKLIKDASMPKLIIHSQDDEIVPFFMAKELFEQASGQNEFWKIHGQHADALVNYPAETVSRINKLAGLAPK